MNLTPTFPTVVDSSMRSAFVACKRQGYYAHMIHLRQGVSSIHLHFGKSVAAGFEGVRKAYWRDGFDATNAVYRGVECLVREWGDYELPDDIKRSRAGVKTLDAAIDALVSYFEYYPIGSDSIIPYMFDGEPAVEMSFALPIPDIYHPDTGEPVLYCGRFDMLGVRRSSNHLIVVDEKTSTALGDRWASSWTLRGQLTGYCWGSRQYGVDAQYALVRGIGVLQGSIVFKEAIAHRPAWHVDAWLRQLQIDVSEWIEAYRRAKTAYPHEPHLAFGQAFDSACTSYSGCPYVELCDTPEPQRYYSDYSINPWNPLDRTD